MGVLAAGAPALPVPLAELKALLRIGTSEEDASLAALLRAAADTCEAFTGRALLSRPIDEMVTASRRWTRLGAAPVTAIEAAALIGADGSATALAAGDYAIDIDAAGEGWVRLLLGIEPKRLRISYRAGMATDPNGLPEALRYGIVRLAAHFYAHRREAEDTGPPAAIAALWRPWRRLRLV
jgi:uncharacterized phiE125 gp8 family phage protein